MLESKYPGPRLEAVCICHLTNDQDGADLCCLDSTYLDGRRNRDGNVESDWIRMGDNEFLCFLFLHMRLCFLRDSCMDLGLLEPSG